MRKGGSGEGARGVVSGLAVYTFGLMLTLLSLGRPEY